MTDEPKITGKIDKEILAGSKRVFLNREEYLTFYEEMEPPYKLKYGGIIFDTLASDDGYDNILYKGVPVCLMS